MSFPSSGSPVRTRSPAPSEAVTRTVTAFFLCPSGPRGHMVAVLGLLWAYLGSHLLGTLLVVGVCAGLLGWLAWALRDHPVGFWFIFWGELAERASFYGMRTILALYMTTVLGFEQNKGASIM